MVGVPLSLKSNILLSDKSSTATMALVMRTCSLGLAWTRKTKIYPNRVEYMTIRLDCFGYLFRLPFVIADDRGRWAVIAADASAGVSQRRLGVTGIS